MMQEYEMYSMDEEDDEYEEGEEEEVYSGEISGDSY